MKNISFKSRDRAFTSAFCRTICFVIMTVTLSVALVFIQNAQAQVPATAATTVRNSAVGQIQFTASNGASISADFRGGDVPGVIIPRGSATVRFDSILPAPFAGRTVRVSSIDGGGVTAGQQTANSLVFTVGADGRLSFTYTPSPFPGTYRVLLEAGSTTGTLRFVVPASTDPASRVGLSFR